MNKSENYRAILSTLDNWDNYLLQESGLPGPRGNLELAFVVAALGNQSYFEHLLTFNITRAPVNSPEEFLFFCGVVGLGELIVKGDHNYLTRLRVYATDPRWRAREGVAMALQRLGDCNMELLLQEAERWCSYGWLEMRAAAAALAEPRLLKEKNNTFAALKIINKITFLVYKAEQKKTEDYKILRQALGYCWSVVVAAIPSEGMPMMDDWLTSDNPDIKWIMKENLRKNRLSKLEPWISNWRTRLELSR